MKGWQLDERAHAGPEHLDPAYVAGYEAKSDVDVQEELALLLAHGLDGKTTLVDLGAGTGALALVAASHCRRVVAVDGSSSCWPTRSFRSWCSPRAWARTSR